MTTIDEILSLYDSSESEIEKTWRQLVIATAGLGFALARFDNALKAFGAARNGATP